MLLLYLILQKQYQFPNSANTIDVFADNSILINMNVSEFSKRIGLSPHTIRYYDKIGLTGKITRLSNGHRSFSEKDVKWIEFVQRLKDTGMPLEKILDYAKLRKKGNGTLSARQNLLANHSDELKRRIVIQTDHLKKLNEKIALYQSAIEGKISLD